MDDGVRKILFLTTTAIALGCIAGTPRADQAPVNVFDLEGREPIAGLPAGPYRAWSHEQKDQARKTIQAGCFRLQMEGNKILMQQNAPDESMAPPLQRVVRQLLQEEAQTLAWTCVAMHLPKDDPEIPKLRELALKHYAAAKALGTKFPPPTFGAR